MGKRGHKQTEETRRKIGLNGFHYGMLNKKHSEGTKRKMSLAKIGRKNPWAKNSLTLFKKGHFALKGEKCHLWRGGITLLTKQIRNCFKYRQWRSDVFTRDNFTCQYHGVKGGNLNAHHIKEFSIIMRENKIKTIIDALACEELWNINNGRTLCKKCHDKIKNGRI